MATTRHRTTRDNVWRGGVGYFFGAYDVHADVLFGSYRLAKTTHEVLAFYEQIRRRYPDHQRVDLVNDNLSLHWTPLIRASAALHNVALVATPTSAVLNASDYASHTEVAVAFRRYLHRRNADQPLCRS